MMRVLLVALLLSACATLPGVGTTLVHERWVENAVAGTGGPVVVFESGLGADLRTWDRVFPAVSERTTAFAYSRPGFGASERSASERSGRVVVEELRELLRARGLKPPYVLVGHSLGGLYLQLFARRYPEEVAGLLLIDSSHPAQMADVRGRPPHSWWTTLINLYMSGTRGREFRALDRTGRDVLALPPLEGKPVIILNAGKDPTRDGHEASFVERERLDLARLHPGSQLRWVDAGHDLHRSHPQVVIEAIDELLASPR